MGSQAIQGKLWGQKPDYWAEIQEPTGKAGYDFVLNFPFAELAPLHHRAHRAHSPVARAIEHSGIEKMRLVLLA